MAEKQTLKYEINEQLPSELVDFIREAGGTAARLDMKLYMVGGVVRDIIIKRPTLDLDLAVDGDVQLLLDALPQITDSKVTSHERFKTATAKWKEWSVDFATARKEIYTHPGALPDVTPGCIEDDLCRRDFSINAMAVSVNPDDFGTMIDLHSGTKDIASKSIRILHANSFIDDATRVWRAVRYEQRLDFTIEPRTLESLKLNLQYLATISGDRIRYELECSLKEQAPEKALRRAADLGLLSKIQPALSADEWLSRCFSQARETINRPLMGIYMALLAYRLTREQLDEFTSYLNLSLIHI